MSMILAEEDEVTKQLLIGGTFIWGLVVGLAGCGTDSVNISKRDLPVVAQSLIDLSLTQPSFSGDNEMSKSAASTPAEREKVLLYIKKYPDVRSYRLLFYLMNTAPDTFALTTPKTRAAILCSAMEFSESPDDFGYMNSEMCSLGCAGNILLNCGTFATARLQAMLYDTRPALCNGSEVATVASEYQFRKCDYAYSYITMIRGGKPFFDINPKIRDVAIEALKQILSDSPPSENVGIE